MLRSCPLKSSELMKSRVPAYLLLFFELGKTGIPQSPLARDGLIKQTVYILCLTRGNAKSGVVFSYTP